MTDQIWDIIRDKLPGFEEREGQVAMMEEVTSAYESSSVALIEAGTGTGKSLAYLIPAILWALEKGEPTIVATNTIALQEQLLQKDIPFIREALELDLKAVLVKGMHNYVCLRKVDDHAHELPEVLLAWTAQTTDGSRSKLPLVASKELWDQVGAEAESCTHVKCPRYKECFFFKARKEAADAHLIIANHHLFFADLALREQSENYEDTCVLPAYKRLIFDEAHHIEDVATDYFASKVSRRALVHFLGRLLSDRNRGKLLTLKKKIRDILPEADLYPLEIALPGDKTVLIDAINHAFTILGYFLAELKIEDKLRLRPGHLAHASWLEKVQPAMLDAIEKGRHFIQGVCQLASQFDDPAIKVRCEGLFAEIKGICHRLENFFNTLHTFIFSPIEPDRVQWIEGESPNFTLVSADLEIAPRLSEALFNRVSTAVLCSATLSTNRNFSFIKERLGIQEALEKIYDSPFDYPEQVILSLPSDLPDPRNPGFTQAAAEKIWEGIEACRGNAFVLFTSYTMLRQCEEILASRFQKARYPLLCQGDEGRSHLLNRFRKTDRSVLFGTDSFWEGVDVVGDALRCVIIVKLPFKVPSDPLFQARAEAITNRGGSPFFDYSLPHAIVRFKQGFGRLIRNKEDRGCVICLDTRLVKKGYGKQFLKSLPTCPTHMDTWERVRPIIEHFYEEAQLQSLHR